MEAPAAHAPALRCGRCHGAGAGARGRAARPSGEAHMAEQAACLPACPPAWQQCAARPLFGLQAVPTRAFVACQHAGLWPNSAACRTNWRYTASMASNAPPACAAAAVSSAPQAPHTLAHAPKHPLWLLQGGSPASASVSPRPAAKAAPRGILKQPSLLGPQPERSQSASPPHLARPPGTGSAGATPPQLPLAQQPPQQQQQQVEQHGLDAEARSVTAAAVAPALQEAAAAAASAAAAPAAAAAAMAVEAGDTPCVGAQQQPEADAAPEAPLQLTPDSGSGEAAEAPEGEGPLELTPDAAVELTPGPVPSRGLKMLQSAAAAAGAAASAFSAPRGAVPACGLSPAARGALAFSPRSTLHASAKAGAMASAATAWAAAAGASGTMVVGVGSVAGRRPRATRGARLLQAAGLQAASQRGGASAAGLPAGASAPAVLAGGGVSGSGAVHGEA